jgi:16S rRNA processing protein RimM
MGEVVAAYGVHGWIKARTFTVSPAALLAHRAWWLGKDGSWREVGVVDGRRHGEAIVALLEGLHAREDAAPWRGASIAVPRSALPPIGAGEVYLADLVGLTVANRQGVTLGRVAGFIETGAHPVLRVAGEASEGRERLIPLVLAYIDAIDLASGRMVVDWPWDY